MNRDLDSIGFIGGGRLPRILLEGWKRAGLTGLNVRVSEPSPEARERLQPLFPDVCFAGLDEVLDSGLIFTALHPPVFKTVLAELPRPPRETSIFISLAPVLDFEALARGLRGHARLVRMIPNAPSMRGEGYNPVAFGPVFPDEERSRVAPFFDALGAWPEIPEAQIEAHAILCAMGPTYFWPQFQVLRELGRAFGVAGPRVDQGLAAMLHGAVDLMFQGEGALDDLMDLIPGKPLNEAQAGILEVYRQQLPLLHQKLAGRA